MRGKYGRRLFSVLVVILWCSVGALPAQAGKAPTLRVGILLGQTSTVISAGAAFTAEDGSGRILGEWDAGEKARINWEGRELSINGGDTVAGPLIFRLKNPDNAYLTVNGRRYRGEIELRSAVTRSGFTVINILDLEEYLYGVLPREISPAWPMEAVKAQAVAARTYALATMRYEKHAADSFDLCNTVDCQVYGGRESEDNRSNQAVDATRGVVITYKGSVIPAYFHSSAGGYTEDSENVWGNYAPYLRAVPDFDQDSPTYIWEKQYTLMEIEDILSRAGYPVGQLQAVELSPLSAAPVKQSPDRGVSGRVKTIKFIGRDGTAVLSGQQARLMFGLYSALFDIKLVYPLEPVPPPQVVIIDKLGTPLTKDIAVNLPRQEQQGSILVNGSLRQLEGDRTTMKVIFVGHGWGHGLGLSQWGAKAMAEKGPPNDPAYYQQILKHYYQGTEIDKLY